MPLTLLILFLSACTSFQVGSEVSAGRRALLVQSNEVALSYFRSAAQKDPNYFFGTTLNQGIWSYVGRTEYATGRLAEARQSLERALSINQQEHIARLYLGLTLARSSDRDNGLKEIEDGMKGIHEFIEYITAAHRFSFGAFWDPRREIRSAIEGDLAMISGREIDWQRLISDGEWLGKKVEEESDLARRDEIRARSRGGSRGRK